MELMSLMAPAKWHHPLLGYYGPLSPWKQLLGDNGQKMCKLNPGGSLSQKLRVILRVEGKLLKPIYSCFRKQYGNQYLQVVMVLTFKCSVFLTDFSFKATKSNEREIWKDLNIHSKSSQMLRIKKKNIQNVHKRRSD